MKGLKDEALRSLSYQIIPNLRRVIMASKMLVDRSNLTVEQRRGVCYCISCAQSSGEMENIQLESAMVTGGEICLICERRIADLPEPPTYPLQVTMQINVQLSVETSSPIEAKDWF